MKSLRNSITLIGRLGQDPEVRTLDKGNKMARFSLATNDSYTAQDGKRVETTQWHNLIVWGKLAGVCEQHLTKGKEIAVDGKLTYRNWEDKSGNKHTSAEIIVNDLLFLGNKQ